ncbi:ABC transporter permease subunit/CPBP intramembrane protease [Bremerella cremea]|uniref:ABC transporter permease subunit/CPBP intramembrane protease n=1 Tax=Bremerella cremea TaxID=1031537 RepID=UPI0031F19FEA
MNWDNVKLILKRELRDQARDRRTLFSVIGLPVLLYPLMGLMVLNVMQFRQAHPTRLRVIGLVELPSTPQLFESTVEKNEDDTETTTYQFAEELLKSAGVTSRFNIEVSEASVDATVVEQTARETLEAEKLDAIIYFPPGFRERMESFQNARKNQEEGAEGLPAPQLITKSSDERSKLAENRLKQILHSWRENLIQFNLEANDVPSQITDPFSIGTLDLSDKPLDTSSYLWAKIFPFIVVIWALTGAFYPAIDLCAGEKERGTLETLLSSPALRSEIVAGKLLAIMTFSIATSVLNLMSMGFTATFVMGQVGGEMAGKLNFGPPPIWSLGWLFLALIPMAALFSALALAIATMARSSKEGQYYLLPLLMLNLPLVVLPVLPDTELSFGTSLIPVSGMSFLLKTLMEGDYARAATYFVPVLAVTAFCIWIAIRWAIDQFNNESVLFRESERFNLKAWLRKVWRDRQPTPSPAGAFVMGIVLLALPHALSGYIQPELNGDGQLEAPQLVRYMLTNQIGLILLPVVVAALIFTRSVTKTFQLRLADRQALLGIPLAIALAICLHPFALYLRMLIQKSIPMSQDLQERLASMLGGTADLPIWAIFAMFAVLPAICEEFACRGFILSGMRHLGHKWAAISISAIFFGMLHGILQQSIPAAIFGLMIGFVAVQCRSLFPAIAFHMVHNSLVFAHGVITTETMKEHPWLNGLVWWVSDMPGEAGYNPFLVAIAALGAVVIVGVIARMPAELSVEERRQMALSHQGTYRASAPKREDGSPST